MVLRQCNCAAAMKRRCSNNTELRYSNGGAATNGAPACGAGVQMSQLFLPSAVCVVTAVRSGPHDAALRRIRDAVDEGRDTRRCCLLHVAWGDATRRDATLLPAPAAHPGGRRQRHPRCVHVMSG